MAMMNMKKITSFIVFLLLLIVSGCSPMPYDDLSSSSGLEFKREEYEIAAQDNGSIIEIRFEVIPDAKSYGYGTSSDNVIQFSASDLTFSSGYYTATIDKNSEIFASENSSIASRAAGSLSVILFASRDNAPKDNWVIVKSVDVELSLTTAPDLSTSDRKKDSVVLKANSESISGGMEYKVDYGTESVTFSSSNLPYTLEGIGTDALTLTVSHKYAGTSDYGTQTQSLTVSAYDERQGAIEAEVGSDGSITASNLTSGYSNIGIFSVSSDGTMSSSPIYSQAYSSNSVTFNKTATFGEGFYAGKIRVALYNDSIDDADAILSAEIDYESPLEKTSENIGRQSYSVIIPISDKITVSDVSLSSNTDSNIKVEQNDDGNIHIWADTGTLISRTTYPVKVSIRTSSGNFDTEFDFTTKSFAGDYLWVATESKSGNYAKQFAVIVEDTPAGSEQNYNVFTSPSDIYFTEPSSDYTITSYEKLRISPLFDENITSGMSYSEAPKPYIWNNEKWNSSDIIPDSLDSYTGEVINKDYTTSVVRSTATFILSTWVDTETSIRFTETENGCYMVFYNEITKGKYNIGITEGNKALLKNPGAYDDLNSSPFYYALELQQ